MVQYLHWMFETYRCNGHIRLIPHILPTQLTALHMLPHLLNENGFGLAPHLQFGSLLIRIGIGGHYRDYGFEKLSEDGAHHF